MAGPSVGGLPIDVTGFEPKAIQPPSPHEQVANLNVRLTAIRVADAERRVDARRSYGRCLLSLLWIQNLLVYGGIIAAAWSGHLAEVGLLAGLVTAATLGETAVIVRIIVKWLFSDIDYEPKALPTAPSHDA